MGLFGKETCAICGRKVGMMGRSRLRDKQLLCSQCRKNGHPFIRLDRINLETFKEIAEQMEKDERYLSSVELSDNGSRILYPGESYRILTNSDEGIFTVCTEETQHYHCRPVFYYDRVREYESGSRAPIHDYHRLVTLDVQEDGRGNTIGYIMRIPYDDEKIQEIVLKISEKIPEEQVRDFYHGFCQKMEYRARKAEPLRGDSLQNR